jgi:CRP-like cAMP-binding protein
MDRLERWWDEAEPRRRRLARDEPLFHRGDPVEAMFRVEEGQVRLERGTLDGRTLILSVAGPGDLIAEASLFADAYHCDATAAEPASISVVAKRRLLAAMASDPACSLAFSRLLARQLQAARHRLEFRNVRSARERVLLYFALHADPVSRRIAVKGHLQDIAAELGLSREAFYRVLAALARDGTVRREAAAIIVT